MADARAVGVGGSIAVVAGLTILGVLRASSSDSTEAPGLSPLASAEAAASNGVTIEVWKSPTCGCCGKWVEHLREAGYDVRVEDVADLLAVKEQHGVHSELRSCHTAVVEGYVVEGHVPAEDIDRLLEERPEVAGLAVPGMPVGSPGMEVGDTRQPYDVLTFDADGETRIWARHR